MISFIWVKTYSDNLINTQILFCSIFFYLTNQQFIKLWEQRKMKGIKFQFQGINNKIEQLLIKAQSPKSFVFSFKKIVLETFNVFNIFLEQNETDTSVTQAFSQVAEKMKKAVHLHNINAFGDEDSEEEISNHNFVDYQIDQVSVFLNSRKPIQSNLQGRGQFYKFLQQAEGKEQDLKQILANCKNSSPTGNLKNLKLQRSKSSKKTKVAIDTTLESRQIQTDINMQAMDYLFKQQKENCKQQKVQPNEKQNQGQQQQDLANNYHQGSITINIIRNQSVLKSKQDAKKYMNPTKKSKALLKNLKADDQLNRSVRNSKLDLTELSLKQKQRKNAKKKVSKQILRKESDNRNSVNSTHNFKINDQKIFVQSNSQTQWIQQKENVRQQQIQTDPLKELKQLSQLENLKSNLKRNMKIHSQASSNSDSEGAEELANIRYGIKIKHTENELTGTIFDKSTTQFSKSFQISKDSSSQQRNGNLYKNGINEKLPTLSTYQMKKPNANKIKIKQGSHYTSSQQKFIQSYDDYDNFNAKNILQQGYRNQKDLTELKELRELKEIKKQGLGLLPSLANNNSTTNLGLLRSLGNTNSSNIGVKGSDRIKMLNGKANLSSIHEKIQNLNNQENEFQTYSKCDKKNLPNKIQQKQKRMMKQIESLVSDVNSRAKNRRKIQMLIQFIQVLHERQCGKSCIHLARFYQFLKRNNIPHRQQVIMHRKNISFEDQINNC